MKELKDYVRTIPDFPAKGIMFRDVTSVLQDADGFHLAIDELKKLIDGIDFDVIVGAESRGFIMGAPLAYEMHKDSIQKGQKVILVDDLIATGGTLAASVKLVEKLGGEVVKVICLMELKGLNGRDKLKGYDVEAVITYEGK